jgi:hypothetical protein
MTKRQQAKVQKYLQTKSFKAAAVKAVDEFVTPRIRAARRLTRKLDHDRKVSVAFILGMITAREIHETPTPKLKRLVARVGRVVGRKLA